MTIPKLKYCYTVCESLATLFEKNYGTHFDVIRNVPCKQPLNTQPKPAIPIILYQGALNDGRGLEEMIEAMKQIDNAEFWIAGEGDLSKELRILVQEKQLTKRVKFLGFLKPQALKEVTNKATIGLNLLQNKGLNYYYSLANKSFDYIQAGIPTINMNFPEYQRIVAKYKVALLVDDLSAETLVSSVQFLLNNKVLYEELQQNCNRAREEYIWEKEEELLINLYKSVLKG